MADLTTSYMGLKINNPFIAGASELTSDLESIMNIASAGAGAIVVKSLFEEQIQLERLRLEDELTEYDEVHAEMLDIHPDLEHGGPQEHLYWLRKVKEAVEIPIFASLNAINRETWTDYAKQIEGTGVDGIELNFYLTPVDMERESADIEKEQKEILSEIKGSLDIPVAVKLSPFYANPLNLVKKMDNTGADGLVLFNRFFQPDIDPQKVKESMEFDLSSEGDYRLPLRYAGLLYGNINADICASSGIFSGMDAAKVLLAGASCVQLVSTLYRNRPDIIGTMVVDLSEWMEKKGYNSIDDFRGKLSKKNSSDPFAYERAQYVSMLMKPEPVMRDFPR